MTIVDKPVFEVEISLNAPIMADTMNSGYRGPEMRALLPRIAWK
jgi:hypothetical protein